MSLGVQDTEIKELHDATHKVFCDQIGLANAKIRTNYDNGKKKTLVFVYYAGHGVLRKAMTSALCDVAPTQAKVFYPLEKQLYCLGHIPGAYVIGAFDCCREEWSPPIVEEVKRGIKNNANSAESSDDSDCNCFITFGCMAGREVSAISTLAVEYIEKLKKNCMQPDGSIVFPTESFLTWIPGDDGQHAPKYQNKVQIRPAEESKE